MGASYSDDAKACLVNYTGAPIARDSVRFLVFGAGGARGLAHIGAYRQLLRHVPAGRIAGVAGCSAGALMAFAACLRLTPQEMCALATPALLSSVGLTLDLAPIEKLLRAMAQDATGFADPTFRQLQAATGVPLVVAAARKDNRALTLFGPTTHPDVSVVDAVLASCAIPQVFRAVTIQGHTYIDGAVACALPMHAFPAAETLGFYLYDQRRQNDCKVLQAHADRIVSIDVSLLGALEFEPTRQLRQFTEWQGRKAVLQKKFV